jgi:hypothetical protein
LLPRSVSFVDVSVLNHQVLRASVGGVGSSRKQDVCVKARAQDDRATCCREYGRNSNIVSTLLV